MNSLTVDILRGIARSLGHEAGDHAEGTDERETFQDASDALLDAADLLENLSA